MKTGPEQGATVVTHPSLLTHWQTPGGMHDFRQLSLRGLMYPRFCQIRYLFQEKGGQKKFHGQWLTHSSKTFLQEAGHPQALYLLLDECEDIDVNAIIQLCNIRDLDPDAHEPSEDVTEENDFHCR